MNPTQFDRMKALFDDLGIKYEVGPYNHQRFEGCTVLTATPPGGWTYSNFYASFLFDAEGAMKQWGCFE